MDIRIKLLQKIEHYYCETTTGVFTAIFPKNVHNLPGREEQQHKADFACGSHNSPGAEQQQQMMLAPFQVFAMCEGF